MTDVHALAGARTRAPVRRLRRAVALVGRRPRGVLGVGRGLLRRSRSRGDLRPRPRRREPCPARAGSRAPQLNYAEAPVPRRVAPDRPALLFASERRPLQRDLVAPSSRRPVAAVAAGLRRLGVGRGDRVVALLPNIPEAVVALAGVRQPRGDLVELLARISARAASSTASRQIEPKVLSPSTATRYGGKPFDRREVVAALRAELPTLEQTVLIPYLDPAATRRRPGRDAWDELTGGPHGAAAFEPVPFDHPLWVLYSSGTTGLPKAIVHGHGGIVLEHSKAIGLHARPPRRRPAVLVHVHRLDDVELPRRRAARRRRPRPLRRQPRLPGPGRPVGLADAARVEPVRHQRRVPRRLPEGRHPARRDPRPVAASRRSARPARRSPLEGFGWVYDAVKPRRLARLDERRDRRRAPRSSAAARCCRSTPASSRPRARARRSRRSTSRGTRSSTRPGSWCSPRRCPRCRSCSGTTPTATRYRESYFEMYPGVWRHGDWITHHRARERGHRGPLRLDPQPPGHPDGHERALRASSSACPRSSTAWSSAWSCPTAATGCRSSSSSPTASSSTTRCARRSRRDQARALAAPRPRRDRRDPGRPAHAHRQEDGGAGQAAAPGTPAGGGRATGATADPHALDFFVTYAGGMMSTRSRGQD